MGVLDDAIREHLELKRQHGASEDEVTKQEQEALGAVRSQPVEAPAAEAADAAAASEVVDPEPIADVEPESDASEPVAESPASDTPTQDFDALEDAPLPAEDAGDDPDEEDVLEETPDFLQETPEHDRLWFEQKPPRDFDFDDE
jgi:hypothetical protein